MKSLHQRALLPLASCALLFAFATHTSHADDEHISHDLNGIEKLEFEISRANVVLIGSDRSDLDLTLEKPSWGFDPENVEQVVEQRGDKLVIKIEYKKSNKSWWSSDKKGYSDAELLVPHTLLTSVQTSGGNISAESMDAPLYLKTSGGNINASDIGAPLEVHTSGGNISLNKIDGDTDAHTSGGNISANEIVGKASLKTSGGNISINGSVSALVAKTSGGHISATIDSAITEPLELRSSGGNVNAKLMAGTNAPATLSTSGGNVMLSLPKDQEFELYAKSNGGHVSFKHSGQFSGELSKKKVEGNINGGGPLVKMNTSGGRVNISEI